MRGKHRRDRRFEPTDIVGAVAIVGVFILAVALFGAQLGMAVTP